MSEPDEKPKPQFFRVGSSIVKDGALRDMSAVELKVYMVLALHANWRTGECWPSYKTISTLSGCCRTSISDAVRRLIKRGAISVQKIKAKNGLRNVYTVFRTLQPSSENRSTPTDYPRRKQIHDLLGRFRSIQTDDPQSRLTDDPQSMRTDHNEIHLNESNGTRSKDSSGASSSTHILSPETIKKLEESLGRSKLETYMIAHGYPLTLLPKEDLSEGEEPTSNQGEVVTEGATDDSAGKSEEGKKS